MYPHWSPDGKKILFSRFGGTYNGGVWVMDADGSNDRLVHAGAYHYPRWSPDGKYIVCDGNPGVPVPDCKEEIYVMNADGSNIHMVTVHPAGCGGDNQGASWSPDGKQLVYGSSDRGPVPMPSIFKINVDGSGETRLTEQETENLYLGGHEPSWSPIP